MLYLQTVRFQQITTQANGDRSSGKLITMQIYLVIILLLETGQYDWSTLLLSRLRSETFTCL